MSQEPALPDQRRETRRQSETQIAVRRLGVLNLFAGLLALFGPAVEENDDGGLVNTESGLLFGVVAVNGPHALLHVLVGILGLRASRDAGSARLYLRASGIFFGVFAAVGWRKFGFERGVHSLGVFAVDGWGNLGHAVVSAFSLAASARE